MSAWDSLTQETLSRLRLRPYQAAVLHRPSNIFWLTGGFTGEGLVLVTPSRPVIVTDPRFTDQAAQQSPAFGVATVTGGLAAQYRHIAGLCREDGVQTLLLEEDFVSVRDHALLRDLAGDDMALLPLGGAVERLRQVKTPREVAIIRRACAMTDAVFTDVLPCIREGMTERELHTELDILLLKHGADAPAFPTIVAFGENGSLPHAVPGERRLRRGDLITMDLGARSSGYCSDLTRTIAFGDPDPALRLAYQAVLETQVMSEEAVMPGVCCCDLDRMARSHLDSAGYAGRFTHALGHSLGIDVHEGPRLSQFCRDTLLPGHIVTVEPGVYFPGLGGIRIENTVLVTADGHEALTKAPRDLIIL